MTPAGPLVTNPGAPIGAGLSRGEAWALAFTATLTMAVSYADRQTLAVLAPTVTKELGLSEAQYGWLISAFSLAYLIGAPLAGMLIDRIGARRGLLGAVLVWSLVAGLHAIVPGFGVLFALRIALGLAEAPSLPGAAQTVQRALPPADRARGFGVLFTGGSIGAMLAPPLAVAMEKRWGFRLAFLGTAAVGLLWIPVWLGVAFRPRARRALDRAVGMAVAAVGPVGGARGAGEAQRAPSGLELLLHPAVLRTVTVVIASSPMMAFLLNWGSKYLVHDHGLTQSEVGGYLIFPPLSMDVGAILFGHLASVRAKRLKDGSPPRALLVAAGALCAMGAASPLGGGPVGAIALASAGMAGGGALATLITADMLARVHPGAVSTAGGIATAAQALSYLVAGPLIGRALGNGAGYPAVLAALGLWVLPGCAAWLLWKPPPPIEETEAPGELLAAEGSPAP